MFSKLFQRENGLTLVEVLASIVLLSIIGILTTIILVQIFKDDETASKSISLKQDTNLLLSSLRHQFYDLEETSLCFDDQGGRLSVEEGTTLLPEDDKETIEKRNGRINGNCIEAFDESKPIHLRLVTRNTNSSKPLTIETTLVKGTEENIVSEEPDSGPCIEDETIEWIEVNELPCTGGNIYWTGDKKQAGCKNENGRNAFQFKNLKVKRQHDFKDMLVNISGNGYFKKQLELKNSLVNVKQGACFKGQFDAKEKSAVTVDGNALFHGEVEFENSNLTIGGDVTFENEFDHKTGIVKIGKDAYFKDQADFENSTVSIGGNATFADEFEFDRGSFTINGTAKFKDQFDFEDGALHIVKFAEFGDQFDFKHGALTLSSGVNFNNKDKKTHFEDGSFTIMGPANFHGPFEMKQGTLYISNDALFKKQTDFKETNATIQGQAIFDNQTELYHSNVSVGRNLESTSKNENFELNDRSKLQVYGDATFAQKIQRSNDSQLCVKGKFTEAGQIKTSPQTCQY